jgi:hypothetical protein
MMLVSSVCLFADPSDKLWYNKAIVARKMLENFLAVRFVFPELLKPAGFS